MKIPKKFYDRLNTNPREHGARLFWVVCIQKFDPVTNPKKDNYKVLNFYIAKDNSPLAILNHHDIYVYNIELCTDGNWSGDWMDYDEFKRHFMPVRGPKG